MISYKHIARRHLHSHIVPAIGFYNVRLRVGHVVLEELIDFTVAQGDLLLLTGPNGAGKSSILNAFAGLPPVTIESGKIEFFGQTINSAAPDERARMGIGYLRQSANIFNDLSVAHNLRLASRVRNVTRREIQRLAELIGARPSTLACNLSGGQRQLLAWHMVTLTPHQVLLLDEPEAGLHRDLAVPEGITAVVCTHEPTRWYTEEQK